MESVEVWNRCSVGLCVASFRQQPGRDRGMLPRLRGQSDVVGDCKRDHEWDYNLSIADDVHV